MFGTYTQQLLIFMDKKEKYYNYVVNDIVKNTEIDYDQETITLPSPSFPLLFFSTYSSFIPSILSFSKYVKARYGAHDEEMDIIWNQYRERIIKLIDNE